MNIVGKLDPTRTPRVPSVHSHKQRRDEERQPVRHAVRPREKAGIGSNGNDRRPGPGPMNMHRVDGGRSLAAPPPSLTHLIHQRRLGKQHVERLRIHPAAERDHGVSRVDGACVGGGELRLAALVDDLDCALVALERG